MCSAFKFRFSDQELNIETGRHHNVKHNGDSIYNSRSKIQDPKIKKFRSRTLDPRNLDPRTLDPRYLDPKNLDRRKTAWPSPNHGEAASSMSRQMLSPGNVLNLK